MKIPRLRLEVAVVATLVFVAIMTAEAQSVERRTVLFTDDILRDGVLGTRAESTQYCRDLSLYTQLQCTSTVSLLNYRDDLLIDFPTKYGLNASHEVISPNNFRIAENWTRLVDGSAWEGSLLQAQVTQHKFWLGTRKRCNEWSTASQCLNGGIFHAASNLYQEDLANCGTRKAMLCVCLNGIPIGTPQPTTLSPTDSPTWASPTRSPTSFPTLSPTTRPTNSPTQFPTRSPTKQNTETPTISPTKNVLYGVTSIDVGVMHACAIIDGGIKCWGGLTISNDTVTFFRSPTWIPGWQPGSGVEALCIGEHHTCFIKSGQVYCWGSNEYGQAGQENGTIIPDPSTVTGIPYSAVSITCGTSHTCTRLVNNHAYCWGLNDHGQLGSGSTSTSAIPVRVFTYADIIGIYATTSSTCVARLVGSSNETWCFGDNSDGQLGIGNAITPQLSAVRMNPDYTGGVSLMSGGNSFFCGIQNSNGAAFCMGRGGSLGNGDDNDRSTITAVTGLDSNVRHIDCALHDAIYRSCAVLNSGEARCWGYFPTYYPCCLGNGNDDIIAFTPQTVDDDGPRDFKQIAVGNYVICAIRGDDNEVWCWGTNEAGLLGVGSENSSLTALVPQPVLNGEPLPPTTSPTQFPTTRAPTTSAPTTMAPTLAPTAYLSQLGTKLAVPDQSFGQFGYSSSLSGDGMIMAVSAPYRDAARGAVWLFTRSSSNWQTRSIFSGTGAGNYTGWKAVLSRDGRALAMAEPYYNNNRGRVWFVTVQVPALTFLDPAASVADVYIDGLNLTETYLMDVACNEDCTLLCTAWDYIGHVQCYNRTSTTSTVFSAGAPLQTGEGANPRIELTPSGTTLFVANGNDIGRIRAYAYDAATNAFSLAHAVTAPVGLVPLDQYVTVSDVIPGTMGSVLIAALYDSGTTSRGVAVYWYNSTVGFTLCRTRIVPVARQVKLSRDGSTLLVSQYSGSVEEGIVRVYRNPDPTQCSFTLDSQITGPGAIGGAYQGHSLAMSDDGRVVAWGGPLDDSQRGAMWTYGVTTTSPTTLSPTRPPTYTTTEFVVEALSSFPSSILSLDALADGGVAVLTDDSTQPVYVMNGNLMDTVMYEFESIPNAERVQVGVSGSLVYATAFPRVVRLNDPRFSFEPPFVDTDYVSVQYGSGAVCAARPSLMSCYDIETGAQVGPTYVLGGQADYVSSRGSAYIVAAVNGGLEVHDRASGGPALITKSAPGWFGTAKIDVSSDGTAVAANLTHVMVFNVNDTLTTEPVSAIAVAGGISMVRLSDSGHVLVVASTYTFRVYQRVSPFEYAQVGTDSVSMGDLADILTNIEVSHDDTRIFFTHQGSFQVYVAHFMTQYTAQPTRSPTYTVQGYAVSPATFSSWYQAAEYCVSTGSHLAMPLTALDISSATAAALSSGEVWVGGEDSRWMNGLAMNTTTLTSSTGCAYLDTAVSGAVDLDATCSGGPRVALCERRSPRFFRIGFNRTVSWHEAKAHCASRGAQIASLTSDTDLWLARHILSLGVEDEDDAMWVGMTDNNTEGEWVWDSGLPVHQNDTEGWWAKRWYDHRAPFEDCVAMLSSGLLDEIQCDDSTVANYVLCEQRGDEEAHYYYREREDECVELATIHSTEENVRAQLAIPLNMSGGARLSTYDVALNEWTNGEGLFFTGNGGSSVTNSTQCVRMFQSNGSWADCSEGSQTIGFLCMLRQHKVPSPTTMSPTQFPSRSPTTSQPTRSPTTSQPTTSPTTSQPTTSPTTSQPTTSPSTSPTTSVPTQSPTTSPSTSPTTSVPTQSPTTTWIPAGLLTGSNPADGQQGTSVAMSDDGSIIAFGAPNGQGAVYVFEDVSGQLGRRRLLRSSSTRRRRMADDQHSNVTYVEHSRLFPTRFDHSAQANFGWGVTLNRNATTLLAGAPGYDDGTGAVVHYERSDVSGEWELVNETLVFSNPTEDGYTLGLSIALNRDRGDLVCTGSILFEYSANVSLALKVYCADRASRTAWHPARLFHQSPSAPIVDIDVFFSWNFRGLPLAITSATNHVLVGNPVEGRVYVYNHDAVLVQTLEHDEVGKGVYGFGAALSVASDPGAMWLAVGYPSNNSVSVYAWTGTGYALDTIVTKPAPATRFGRQVAMSGDGTLLMIAYAGMTGGDAYGMFDVFRRESGGGFERIANPVELFDTDQIGMAMAASAQGLIVAIGDPEHNQVWVYQHPIAGTRGPTVPRPSKSPVVSAAPSKTPTTAFPTQSPTTSVPTKSPTQSPTQSPTTSLPTQSPTKSPTTSVPTKSPTTSVPTKSPTQSPTTSLPTQSPTTSLPTQSPTTSLPTQSPTTSLPTQSPTTSLPTQSPTTSLPTQSPTTSAPSVSPTTSAPTKSPTRTPVPGTTQYFISSLTYTRDNAAAFCRDQGAQLASIISAEEQAAAVTAAGGLEVYISLSDAVVEGTWRWLDSTMSTIVYTNWGAGEGSNAAEDCVLIGGSGANVGKWADWPCDTIRHALCERRSPGYFVINQTMTWIQARDACEEQGAVLASITSQGENNLARHHLGATGTAWIGLNDFETANTWRWRSGVPASYTAWLSGFPWATPPAGEDCVSLILADGLWKHQGCTNGYPALCERRAYPHYYLINTVQQYAPARTACLNQGATLATINSYADWSRSIWAHPGVTVWIGLNDAAVEGTWRWDSNEAITAYTRWNGGEPNNAGTGEDYVTQLTNGLWNDAGGPNTGGTSTAASLCMIASQPDIASETKYFLSSLTYTRDGAAVFCRQQGLQLASIVSAAEQANARIAANGNAAWLSLNDRVTEGTWRWLDGQLGTSSYANWGAGEGTNGPIENCAAMAANGLWGDGQCSGTFRALCERRSPGYFHVNTLMTWEQARVACEQQGAVLASITSIGERNLALYHMGETAVHAWIGLNDLQTTNTWRWRSGVPASEQRFWAGGYPNPSAPSGHDCVLQNAYGSWEQVDCYARATAICERRAYPHYYVIGSQNVWAGGIACWRLGGSFAAIKSDAQWVRSIVSAAGAGDVWIDLTDSAVEGTYRWGGSNELVTYFKWAGGQPNAGTAGAEDYGWMGISGRWYLSSGGPYLGAMCMTATQPSLSGLGAGLNATTPGVTYNDSTALRVFRTSGIVNLAELMAFPAVGANNQTNIALGTSVTQSFIWPTTLPFSCTDGVVIGVNTGICHADNAANQWIQANLGSGVPRLDQVMVWNRQNPDITDRILNTFTQVMINGAVVWQLPTYYPVYQYTYQLAPQIQTAGYFVQISRTGECINLREVEVYRLGDTTRNIARGRPVELNTDYGGSSGTVHCTNGVIPDTDSESTICHTGCDAGVTHTLTIRLGPNAGPIGRIVIYNRIGSGRLTGGTVAVGYGSETVWSTTVGAYQAVYDYTVTPVHANPSANIYIFTTDQVLNLAEIQVYYRGAETGTNIAAGRTVTQSSILDNTQYPPSECTDGVTATSGNMCHTGSTGLQWIQVDLGALTRPIGRVRIWNRVDGFQNRAVGLTVQLRYGTEVVWSRVITVTQADYDFYLTLPPYPPTTTIIKISHPSAAPTYLNLGEIEAYQNALGDPGVNIARGRTVTQSSILSNINNPPSECTDGVQYVLGNWCATNGEAWQWIQVDLGALTKPVRRIRIWNRADESSSITGQIVGAFVELFVNGNAVWSAPITADQVVYQWNVPNYYY